MALTESTTMPLGTSAPEFTLPDTRNNQSVSLADFSGQSLVVLFICNHCPYVIHLMTALTNVSHDLAGKGIATVAISSNDASQYPQDAPDKMSELAQMHGFEFPYCYDESQGVAKAYGAACTPDIFLFDSSHQLYYHGQFDETRPGQGQAHGQDLLQAATALLAGKPASSNVRPSVGCSIKWKA